MQVFMQSFITAVESLPNGYSDLGELTRIWLRGLSDCGMAIAYYFMPVMLLYLIRQRQDLPLQWVFVLFSSFMVAGGTAHLMDVWAIWHPNDWLSGGLTAIAAIISLYTAVHLIRWLPNLLTLPGLVTINRELEREIVERQQMEDVLQHEKNNLELRVAERTAELLQSNQQLQRKLDERKQIQESLQISQARFAGMLEIANDAIISVDANQHITLFNQGAERIFGYMAEEVLGQSLDLLLPDRLARVHRQHVDQFAQLNGRARRMGERSEIFGRRKDGHEFPAEASISRLHLGHETVFTAILRDISERKQTELALSQLAAIIESSEDAIVSKTLDGAIVSWNASAERLYGYTSVEAIGQPIGIIVPPDRLDEEDQILQKIQQGERIRYHETVRQRKNGTLVDVALTVSPVKDTRGQIVGISTIARDITDRLQIDRMKSEFISIVSHELRTPLTSIHGSLGMLASGLLKPDSDQGKRMLQIAVDSTNRLMRLINDILDIERIESGRVTMAKELCTVESLITEAVNVVQTLADQAGVTLSVASLSLQIWVDPDRIVQTLTNLLSNAIKFSPAGHTVWLTADVQGQESESHPPVLLFTVKDQGRGIPADKLDSIFGRFQQVDSSDSRNHEGTGLGLAICRSIVQQHDGRIWVESQLGKGSTFFFTLPLQESQGLDLPVVQEVPLASAPLVLVCDDDSSIRAEVQALLERHHCRVIPVACGQEAIAQAIIHRPDVILLELLMSDMNGWETMSKLKEHPETQNIPIVICSISASSEIPPQTTNVVHWVGKPLSERLLLQSLEQALLKPVGQSSVLIVEDDPDLAKVLVTLFEQHNMAAFHASTGREAIRLSQQINPDLLILDVILPEGDGFAVVEWLRQHNRLCDIPLVVYSARDLNASERDRLKLGYTEFLGKEQVTIQEFEQRVMVLLQRLTQTDQE